LKSGKQEQNENSWSEASRAGAGAFVQLALTAAQAGPAASGKRDGGGFTLLRDRHKIAESSQREGTVSAFFFADET
jgi:hypothetical protein